MTQRIQLHAGDITALNVDAIVNAANSSLLGGGGVDGAIHNVAGPELVAASKLLAPCPAGDAKLTPGFNLPARYVIHAVGPVYGDGSLGESDVLRRTYKSALQIASSESMESVAFPCISTGVYRFPADEACQIAIETVMNWQANHDHPDLVVFCCFGQRDVNLYAERLEPLGILQRFQP